MKETKKKAFLEFEANSYFKRNYNFLTNYDSENDIIIKLIDQYSLKFETICELGCSAGGRLDFIDKKYSPKKTIGLDPSENAIIHGKKCNKNIFFHKGTSDNLKFISSQSVDLLIIGFFLYVVDRELLLKSIYEIDRVLKKNGTLRILVPDMEKFAKAYVKKDKKFFIKAKEEDTSLRQDLGYGGMLANLFVSPGQDTVLFDRNIKEFSLYWLSRL